MVSAIVIMTIMFILGALLIVVGFRKDIGISIGFGLILFIGALFILFDGIPKEKIKALEADENITWYLDGQEVDAGTFDSTQYDCKLSEDRTKVYMTIRAAR